MGLSETLCHAYDDGTISMETFLYDWQYDIPVDTFLYYQVFECGGFAP